MGATRRNVLRTGIVGGGAALLSQAGAAAARAVEGEDVATRGLRTALANAAGKIANDAGLDERGRIRVVVGEGAVITLKDTLIIGGNTCLDATGATILADFPTVSQSYAKDTVNAHSPTPVYPASFTAARSAPAVSHATMVLNQVPATSGRYAAPGNIRIQGGIWDPTAYAIRNANADDKAKATAAPPLNVITMQHTSNVEIEDVEVRNVKWWHAIELNAVHTATVSRCRLLGWVEDPTVGLWHGEAIQLDLATAATTWKGAADNTPCANIRLVDNVCDGGWGRFAGSHTSVAGKTHTDVTIEFNTIAGTKFDAIGPQDTERLTVRANTVTGCRGGIYLKALRSSLSRIDIVDNVVATTDPSRPLLAAHDADGQLTIADVAVFANTVDGPGGYWYTHASARPGHSLQGRPQ